MFSSDKNVETIGQLVEVLKHYIGLRSEYMKLDITALPDNVYVPCFVPAIRSLKVYVQSTTGTSSPNSSGRKRGQTFSVMQMTEAARRLPISQDSASVLP